MLSEVTTDRRPRFWLEEIEEPPSFAQPVGEDDAVDQGYVPLLARFDWASGQAEVLWDGAGDSPRIEVYDRGVHLFGDRPPGARRLDSPRRRRRGDPARATPRDELPHRGRRRPARNRPGPRDRHGAPAIDPA
ncbi:hypothetical protein V2I01_38720 [Micromonospora sp. BRA006-A]|nr:hypothetical protein [Micromonospora sp. BRA006-A]